MYVCMYVYICMCVRVDVWMCEYVVGPFMPKKV